MILLGFMRHQLENFQKDQKFIEYAFENNITAFETCEFYMEHQCESYVYKLLQSYNREQYQIFGKMPKYLIRASKWKQVFNQQLAKVPSNYFDFYMLQALDETSLFSILNSDIVNFFQYQKQLGNIKNFGLSIQCDSSITQKYLELQKWDFIQMPFNYFDWFLCETKFNYELAKKYKIPIIAQSPLKGGLLKDYEAAYSFLKQFPEIQYVLCGNTKIETLQLTQQFLNNDTIFPNEYYIKKIQEYRKLNFIKCLGCNLCTEICPNKIPVMGLIQMYNRALVSDKCFIDFSLLKHSIGEPVNICTNCKKCIAQCPLRLNIPDIFQNQIFELRT